MAEYILNEFLRWRNKIQIGIMLDEKFIQSTELSDIVTITEKFRELGKIKAAIIITDKQLKDEQYKKITSGGFTVKVVPEGNVTLDYLLEAYDFVLSGTCDVIVFGTEKEELLPLFTDTRNKVKETFALVSNKQSAAFNNSFDEVINLKELATYNFEGTGDLELEKYTEKEPISKNECMHIEDEICLGPVSEADEKNDGSPYY